MVTESKKHKQQAKSAHPKSPSAKPRAKSQGGAKTAMQLAKDKRRKSSHPHKRPLDSPKSRAFLCPYSAKCGGCSAIEVPYEQQLAEKQQAMETLFATVAPGVKVCPILGMANPFHYRDKVISPYAPGRRLKDVSANKGAAAKNGPNRKDAGASRKGGNRSNLAKSAAPQEILTGMYERGSHRLIPAEKCLVENMVAKQVILAIRDIMARWNMAPYNEDTGAGFIRHAVVRVGHESGEVLVTVVTNTEAFPASKAFCRELVRRVPAVTTVVQNVNSRNTNVILGEKERVLYGPGFILDTLCGLSFRISSKSFYQVNSAQTEVLYNSAMELAQLGPKTWAIDAYCGTGTIGLVAASRGAARVIGVDSVESAIADARQNAHHNRINNAEFFTADATAFMEQLAQEGGLGAVPEEASPPTLATATAEVESLLYKKAPSEDHGPSSSGTSSNEHMAPASESADELVLFMDPPRSGSTPQFIRAACGLNPARVVYISCNPTTQVRDLQEFAKFGYRATCIQPVDMFPHTDHTECIVLLEPAL